MGFRGKTVFALYNDQLTKHVFSPDTMCNGKPIYASRNPHPLLLPATHLDDTTVALSVLEMQRAKPKQAPEAVFLGIPHKFA